MRLQKAMEQEGAFLFKYRGQFPLLFFCLGAVSVYFTDFNAHAEIFRTTCHILSAVLVTLGMMIRFYTVGTSPAGTSGRNTEGQVADKLNTTGIYSVVRHPLYLGNYLVWLGLVVFSESMAFVAIFSLIYWIYYERIMLTEEAFIAGKYGPEYEAWSDKVPAFIPSLKGFVAPRTSFSFKPGLRGEYSGVIAVALSYLFLEALIGWKRYGTYAVGERLIDACALMIAISLVLRTLKHHTSILNRKF